MNLKEIVLKTIQVKKHIFKLRKLEANLRYVKSQLEQIQNDCSHDLILHLGGETMYSVDNDFAICVCCGRKFHLNNFEDNEIYKIDSRNILSVIDIIPFEYRHKVMGKDRHNFLLLRAQEKLEELSCNSQLVSTESVKGIIASDLIEYVDEYKQKEAQKLALIKKQNK